MNENLVDFLMLTNLGPNTFYKGSFANNELGSNKINIQNLKKSHCFGFICNTLSRHQTHMVGHWYGISVRVNTGIKNITVKYIDSYNIPYAVYGTNIDRYIGRLRLLALENNFKFHFEETPFRLQGLKSATCGIYCIYGLTRLGKCTTITLKSIFSKFYGNTYEINDSIMVDYAIKIWPRTFCSDIFTTSTKGIYFCPKKLFKSHKCLTKCRCGRKCCAKPQNKQYISSRVKQILI